MVYPLHLTMHGGAYTRARSKEKIGDVDVSLYGFFGYCVSILVNKIERWNGMIKRIGIGYAVLSAGDGLSFA